MTPATFISVPVPVASPPIAPPVLRATNGGFTVVRCGLGLLLLTTALFKASGGSGELARAALPFVSPRLYSAGIWFEAVLGAWLIAGIAPAWSWLSSLGFFALLAYLSLRLGLLGQASCGCFGNVAVNPWWAFAIDVAALLALVVWRPKGVIAADLRAGVPTLAGAGVFVAAFFGFLTWQHGSMTAAIAHVRGEFIVVSPSVADIGNGSRGDVRSFPLRVTNFGDKFVRVVGGTSDCTCVTTDDLPIELKPKQERTIHIRVTFFGSPGEFRRKFVLYCDEQGMRVMPATVTGWVTDSEPGQGATREMAR